MARRTVTLPSEEELPAGPLRELTAALHELYVAAGCPSLREISESIAENDDAPTTVSHERVRQVLAGKGENASCAVVVAIAMALAGKARPARDADAEADRFSRLWRLVAGYEPWQPFRPDPVPQNRPGSHPHGDNPVLDASLLASRSPRDIARQLCQVGAEEPVEEFLTVFIRRSDATMIIELIGQLRMAGLHTTAERLIDLSAQNLPFHGVDELLWRFYKEDWRRHPLLTAIARRRTPGEVCDLLRQMTERRRPEAETLRNLFRELRSDEDDAELAQLLQE
ncbi:hypothetical protein [Streptomyces sp. enrichment culture]|uniref:hypothetical protein n=1 Tax=Streptomyces sp. enrichment culture TaxID=1795815 RepID=UPI003F573215